MRRSCDVQRYLIRYLVKRKVYREVLDFSAASLDICCGSFGALQIPKDCGRNDKQFGLVVIIPISMNKKQGHLPRGKQPCKESPLIDY